MDSVRSYLGFGKVVLPAMGHLGCAWCLIFVERHHEISNAIVQPLPAINDEKKQEISFAFYLKIFKFPRSYASVG